MVAAMNPMRAAPDGAEFRGHADFYQRSEYAAFPQEHRGGGSFGQHIFTALQPAFDFIDPASRDVVFVRTLSDGPASLIDLGDGPDEVDGFAPDELVVYPSGTEARTRVTGPHKIALFTVPQTALDRLFDEAGLGPSAFSSVYGRFQRMSAAAAILEQIWQIAGRASKSNGLLLDGLTLQFLAIMAGPDGMILSPIAAAQCDDARILRAIDYVEAHLGEALTVNDVASIACLSAPHFSRVFRATMGESVWSYVQRRRAERAFDLIRSGKTPLTEIAGVCGYANAAHLTRACRARFGLTPSKIREQT